jgi:DNA-binding Lrp family transcriptional regulator
MADKLRRKKEPRHIRLYFTIMETEAWHHLSGNAIKVLLQILRLDNGSRNGQIAYSYRRAAEETGLSARTCLRCLKELEDKGFLRCTVKGSFSRKVQHASTWRYTWQAWPEGKMGPSRDFEEWRADGKARVRKLEETDAVSNTRLETDPLSGAGIAAEETEKAQICDLFNFDKVAPLNCYQGDAGNVFGLIRRRQRHAEKADSLSDLRRSLMAYLEGSEPGEQSRLAIRVGCPGGTLSKFKHGRPLPAEYVEPLAREIGERRTPNVSVLR